MRGCPLRSKDICGLSIPPTVFCQPHASLLVRTTLRRCGVNQERWLELRPKLPGSTEVTHKSPISESLGMRKTEGGQRHAVCTSGYIAVFAVF